jgi:pyruvate/2-oxoglutarate/acetoin dehydrogenase E1 component
MRVWMMDQGLVSAAELDEIERDQRRQVEEGRAAAWSAYRDSIQTDVNGALALLADAQEQSDRPEAIARLRQRLEATREPIRKDVMVTLGDALLALRHDASQAKVMIARWRAKQKAINERRYGSHLHSESGESALHVKGVSPVYSAESPSVYGFELLNACFDAALARDPRIVAFGEDVGRLGDVNQGFAGLQTKYGELRVSDTGIREVTIIGQAIGMALRGLRPIAEIQYLDYLLYGLQLLSDDLATLHWRTAGGQKAPVIIRTRGHRLEGVWHSGSPIGGIIHLVRGIHVLAPRNMTQAAGFYNTMLRADEPAIIIEVLNGYRLKEKLPANIGDFTVPLGTPEVLRSGDDLTLVTYGALCPIALEAANHLATVDIHVEVIDAQSLLPFDRYGWIGESLKKTSRLVIVDEDVPGGASATILQQILEGQGGYAWLDSEPRTITAKAHRPAYGSDGNYFSKPSVEDIVEVVYAIMNEADPRRYPDLF